MLSSGIFNGLTELSIMLVCHDSFSYLIAIIFTKLLTPANRELQGNRIFEIHEGTFSSPVAGNLGSLYAISDKYNQLS